MKNCYKHHGREDLLPEFGPEQEKKEQGGQQVTIAATQQATLLPSHTVVQTINNPDGTVSLIQVDTGNTVATLTADVAVSRFMFIVDNFVEIQSGFKESLHFQNL